MAEIINNRYIIIDDDTRVGYDYPNEKFYVINKGTKTTRNTAEQIVSVLGALGIADYTATRLEELIKNNIETLGSIECTLTDNGSYIRTLQFNEWVDYPLAVDCEKKNLYIKGTNVSFSLDIDDSNSKRAEEFCSYYRLKLGLDIDENIMKEACRLLTDQYQVPSFYNVLSKNDETNILKYTNTFKMNDFSDKSSIVCDGTNDPEQTFNNIEGLEQIRSIDNTSDLVVLRDPYIPTEENQKFLTPGFQVSITGTTYEEDGTTYTADGTYTINQVFDDESDKVISVQVNEPITASYEYPYPTCYAQSLKCSIYSMERKNNIIRVNVSQFPEDLVVGDIIHVENAQVGSGLNYINLDGPYTVQSISNQVKQISDSVIKMENNGDSHEITISTSETQLKVGDILEIEGTDSPNDNILYTVTGKVESSDPVILKVEQPIEMTYGIIETSASLEFNHTNTNDIIILPESFSNVVINPKDFIEIKDIPEPASGPDYSPNNKLYTILNVIRNTNNTTTLIVDSTVVSTEGAISASVILTPVTKPTLTSSTILYYNIYTAEEILTDFVSTSEKEAYFYKEVLINKVDNISTDKTVITLEDIPEGILESRKVLYIHNTLQDQPDERIIENISENNIVLTEALSNGMPEFPQLNLIKPASEVMLSILTTKGELINVVPTGDFMLDNFGQCQAYVESLRSLDIEIAGDTNIPSLQEDMNNNMYNELKKNTTLATIGSFDVTFKGLYSEVYTS